MYFKLHFNLAELKFTFSSSSSCSPESLSNVVGLWSQEVRHFCRGVPVILVGNKIDLRPKNEVEVESNNSSSSNRVTTAQGKSVSSKIKATRFVECSAKTKDGIEAVFQAAAKAAVAMRHNRLVGKLRTGCSLL